MPKPKMYIETTIFNYYFDKEREAHADTVKLFKEILAGKYEPYTSEYVTNELAKAPIKKQKSMLNLLDEYNIILVKASSEAERLANVYIQESVIPAKYTTDALHIAAASVRSLDFIVSLNFRHIVKRKTILMTEVVNVREGYKKIGIFSPMEVVDNEEDV